MILSDGFAGLLSGSNNIRLVKFLKRVIHINQVTNRLVSFVLCDIKPKSLRESALVKAKNIPYLIKGALPSISSPAEIHDVAIEFRNRAKEMGNFKVATCANVASKDPMVDGEGNILASHVFSWSDNEDTWWKRPQLALSSPIPRACRYESCLLYTSDAADEEDSVDLGGRRII